MFSLGFFPTFVVASVLNGMGLLRVPREVEVLGLDYKAQAAYEDAVADVKRAETATV